MSYLEVRSSQPVPILIRFASDIKPLVVEAITGGVSDAVLASGQNRGISRTRTERVNPQDPASTDFHIDYALKIYGEKERANKDARVPAERIIESINRSADADKLQWLVLVTNRALKGYNVPFFFAVTDPEYSIAILSTYGLERGDDGSQHGVLRRVARHETSHLFGLVIPRTQNIDTRPGVAENHCATDYCTLRQSMDYKDFLRGVFLEREKQALYCPDDFEGFSYHPAYNPQVHRTNYYI